MIRSVFAVVLLGLGVAACGEQEPAPVVYRGTNPASSPPPTSSPVAAAPAAAPAVRTGEPDARGVIYYDGYEAIRAGSGDTVESMAARVGLSASELAAYNGLPAGYTPQAGDELVLPPRPQGYGAPTRVASAQPASSAPQPLTGAPRPLTGAATTQVEPLSAPGPADQSGGWSPEVAESAIQAAPAETRRPDYSRAATPPPPSATEALPADTTPAPTLESPRFEQYQTTTAPQPETPPRTASAEPQPAPAASSRFARPVDGPIVAKFNISDGAARNNGVDFAANAGAPVRAAQDGVVALISRSLGGLGNIVLLRHDSQLLTVYGRVDDISVSKGQRVTRGEQIATVARPRGANAATMHFEVRKGASSVDPEDYF